MPVPPKLLFVTVSTALLFTACDRSSPPSGTRNDEHEALLSAVAAVQADTRETKSSTDELKSSTATVKANTVTLLEGLDALKADGSDWRISTAAIQADLTLLKTEAGTIHEDTSALKSGLTNLQSSVGSNLNTQLSGIQSSLGTPSSGSSLYATFMAARRYSRTCNPATDSWLRTAWPGLSDAEITDACRRDGRWHYFGTLSSLITGAATLPGDMQVGLSGDTRRINPVSVTWDGGISLCTSPLGVGPANVVSGSGLVYLCFTYINNLFAVTYSQVDQEATQYTARNYRGYSGGSETALPCSSTPGWLNCSGTESLAGSWSIYVRQ